MKSKTVSISVPNDLYVNIKKYGPLMNISSVCQGAIRKRIALIQKLEREVEREEKASEQMKNENEAEWNSAKQ